MTQTDFATTSKDLMTKFKESVKEIITDQDAEVSVSLQIKYILSKQDDQDKNIYYYTEFYIEHPERKSANNKVITKFENK